MIISLIRGDSHSLWFLVKFKIQNGIGFSLGFLRRSEDAVCPSGDFWRLVPMKRYRKTWFKKLWFRQLTCKCGSNVFIVGFISWNIHKLDISFSSLTISKFHNLIKRFVLCLIPLKLNISRIWIFFLVCFWSALHFSSFFQKRTL